MKTLEQTPTRPRDYAALSLTYAAITATVGQVALRRGSLKKPEPLSELAWTSLAAFALSQAVVHEKVETWLRRPFLEEADGDQQDADHEPRGTGLRYAVGELLACTRCSGAWASLGLTSLTVIHPTTGRLLTRVLAASAVNDFLQTGFVAAREAANLEVRRAGR